MEFLIPLMPLFGALPIAVAAVVIARMWSRRRDVHWTEIEAQNHECLPSSAAASRSRLPASRTAMSDG